MDNKINSINGESIENQGANGVICKNIDYIKEVIENLKENNLLKYYILRFENYFTSIGFKKEQGLELVGEDDTILFTNSAIVSLKKYVINGEKIPNYFITQPCIRLQNLNSSITEEPLYMSSFHMIGAFISVEKYELFIEQVWQFLLIELEYEVSDIKIFCNKEHSSLIEGWAKLEDGPEIIFSDESFDWKFGEGDKMKGHGFDFRVRVENGEYHDIGNIMEIISNGNVIGYGLGLGVETLISKKRNYNNPIQFFTENSGIKLEKNEDIYLYDFLKVIIDSYRNSIKSGGNLYGYELKKAFKKINLILTSNLRKYLNLYEEISSIEKFIYGDNVVSKVIYDELIKRSNFQIGTKPFSILLKSDDDVDLILEDLSSKYNHIQFKVIDIYEGENIGTGNKSVTFSMKYVSEKSKSKDFFKKIVGQITETYKIR